MIISLTLNFIKFTHLKRLRHWDSLVIRISSMVNKGLGGLKGKGKGLGGKGNGKIKKRGPITKSSKAGLQFPVGRLHRQLKLRT